MNGRRPATELAPAGHPEMGHGPDRRAFLALLCVTAAVSGALVMVVEIMGSRVIGPFYGVSLFVWTSLISVTLIALAAGYAAGGALSDRWRTPSALYGLLVLAGMLVLLVPSLKGPVLKLCQPLGLRAGSFASALLLFGPPLFVLGCVSPYTIRLAAREMATLGRTVGGFYALSTLGSVAGTVLTGFVLIAHLGVEGILLLTGGTLIGLGLIYFVLFRRRWAALVCLAVFLLPLRPDPARPAVLPNGTRVRQVTSLDSFYGTMKVVDYTYGPVHTRELLIDGLIQGGIDMRTGESIYPYSYYLQYLPLLVNPGGTRALVIGLGTGIVPRWYAARGVETDVVEIAPDVVRLAETYFGFSARGRVFVEDARRFLATTDREYDFVILDVATGDTTPGHVLSLEAMQLARARLNDGGVLGVNVVGSLGREPFMTASVIRTLRAVFGSVGIYPTYDPTTGDGSGNLVLVARVGQAGDGYPTLDLGPVWMHELARREAPPVARPVSLPREPAGRVLTDDFNPIDVYDAWLREKVRRAIMNGTDWDVLISSR